jgi:ABC-type dipeptide/oligopeptide/nickel transport system permease subunit
VLGTVPLLAENAGNQGVSARTGRARWSVGGLIAGAVLAALVLMSLLAPLLAPYGPNAVNGVFLAGPSGQHLLGTDELGRDVLSRVIWGGRGPLLVAVISMGLSTIIGVPLGIVAGYFRNPLTGLLMRLMDVLLAFPALILGFVVIAIMGSSLTSVVVAITVSFVPLFVRVAYTSTLSVRQENYILAARSLGTHSARILRRHVLRNISPEVAVMASSAFGWALLLAATLNFLGMGIHPPTADWGAMLNEGTQYLAQAWWISVGPGVALTLSIFCGNLFGDELADRLAQHGGRLVTVED